MTAKSGIDFTNTERAFANRSTKDLKQAEWMFKMLNTPIISPIGKNLLKLAVKLHLPVKTIIKATLYRHFVGGENLQDCLPTVKRLAEHNVKSILDYSEEGRETEQDMEKAFRELLRNIEFASEHEYIPISVFKVTAIAPSSLLEKVSNGDELNENELTGWNKVIQRVDKLCNTAFFKNVPLMFDAEETWIQKAIDDLAIMMMSKYNKERIIVINTFQMYRKDRLDYLKRNFEEANMLGYKIGAKLVRGAYMEKERARAAEKGYPSPIQDTKEDTDRDYNEAVGICMDHLENIFLVVATHNEKSCTLAAEKMLTLPFKKNYEHLWFSQLLGMCDHISNTLAGEGFNVAKYVPYGPVASVTPYLIRRADENSSVAGQAKAELKLLKNEINRRKKVRIN